MIPASASRDCQPLLKNPTPASSDSSRRPKSVRKAAKNRWTSVRLEGWHGYTGRTDTDVSVVTRTPELVPSLRPATSSHQSPARELRNEYRRAYSKTTRLWSWEALMTSQFL